MARDGEQRGHAGCIVVSTVKNPCVGRAEVIVMGRDDDWFRASHRAIDPPEDVCRVVGPSLGGAGQKESPDAEVRESEGLEYSVSPAGVSPMALN